MKILTIIQARLTSTRLPGKVLMKIDGESMISRVCKASRDSKLVTKTVVAWAHKFPHLNENDVLGRYREIVSREKPDLVVRLTSDCPLLQSIYIDAMIVNLRLNNEEYVSNHLDGYDVQVFYPHILWSSLSHSEHVIADFSTPSTGLSVNTAEDLERVRETLCKMR